MKKEAKTRKVTGERALKYTKFAGKLVRLNLASAEERKTYFDAIYALRELSDKYCELTGIDIESFPNAIFSSKPHPDKEIF